MSVVPQLIVNSLIAAGAYALIAMGFNLIYGVTKFFNLAHGVLAAVGGYIVFFLVNRFAGLPLGVDVLIAILFTGLFAFLIDRMIYTPLRKNKASNMILLVASLGVFTVIQAGIAMLFTSQFHAVSNSTSSKIYQIGSASITETHIIILGSAVVVLSLLTFLLRMTSFGRIVRAVSDDEEVAKIVGINTERIIGWTFFIGSAITGLAGVLIGFDIGIEPNMGLSLLLKGVIAAIVGGIGSISGAFLGALLLGFVENFGIWHISGEWKDSIAFVLLIVFLIFRPQGIMKK